MIYIYHKYLFVLIFIQPILQPQFRSVISQLLPYIGKPSQVTIIAHNNQMVVIYNAMPLS